MSSSLQLRREREPALGLKWVSRRVEGRQTGKKDFGMFRIVSGRFLGDACSQRAKTTADMQGWLPEMQKKVATADVWGWLPEMQKKGATADVWGWLPEMQKKGWLPEMQKKSRADMQGWLLGINKKSPRQTAGCPRCKTLGLAATKTRQGCSW